MADTSPSLDSSAILIGALMPTRRSGATSLRSERAIDWIRGVWSDRENLNPLKSIAQNRSLIKLIDDQKMITRLQRRLMTIISNYNLNKQIVPNIKSKWIIITLHSKRVCSDGDLLLVHTEQEPTVSAADQEVISDCRYSGASDR